MLNKKHNETTFLLSISFSSNPLKSQRICERKIDVTATVWHTQSTGAEFGVSAHSAQFLEWSSPKFVQQQFENFKYALSKNIISRRKLAAAFLIFLLVENILSLINDNFGGNSYGGHWHFVGAIWQEIIPFLKLRIT